MHALRLLLQDALAISWTLARIIIPVAIILRILQPFGVIDLIGQGLQPLMGLMDLPGSMGIVWATALLTNLYGAIVAFAALAPGLELTQAQVSVLATVLLVAHNFPIEIQVVRRSGTRLIPALLIRFGGAIFMGIILSALLRTAGWLQDPARLLWNPPPPESLGHLQWALEQLRGLAIIFIVVLGLLLLMRLLQRLGITRLMEYLLAPLLRLLGIGHQAAPITVVGIVVGLAYGGGLIIREVEAGRVPERDAFYSLSLMALVHALIEDTLLMMAIGADIWVVLWGRLLLSLLLTFILVRFSARLSDRQFRRWLHAEPAT